MAGLAKNVEADTVLLGTSMAANYRASWIGETFGTTAVRLTIPDGYYSEFDRLMEVLFRAQSPERVIFGMDLNTLIRTRAASRTPCRTTSTTPTPWTTSSIC